ncbi:MAG: carotenoid biosynthesis protein [Bacteroidales bacterium]|nr:carotenoid biosynthesis protein [Bacteroidales bacterium]
MQVKARLPEQDKIRSFFLSWYLIGFAGFAISYTYDIFRQLISLSILLSVTLLLLYHRNWSIKFLISAFTVMAGGWLIELIGTGTGFPFGHYRYTDLLIPLVAGVPLILGLNWLLLVYCTFIISSYIPAPRSLQALAGALMMTGYDLLLEPFAIHTGMWIWEGDKVPLSNYISWFVLSFVFIRIMFINPPEKKNRLGIHLFVYQAGFFAALVLTWKLMSL